MRAMRTTHPIDADADEIAAALAAVQLYRDAVPLEESTARPAWQLAGVLTSHGTDPAGSTARPSWASAERSARVRYWSGGLLGGFD
jgi:uncharacterized protein RhaS with RHS repeats